MSVAKIILKPRRAQPFFARHPWVYPGAIERVDGEPIDGAEVEVHSGSGNFIARGLYNSRSKIRVRLFSWVPDEELNREFFRHRLQTAIALRETLGLRGSSRGCRLVFSEGDYLPGLVIDEYCGWLVVQFTSLGLAERREMLADLLEELLKPKGIYLRTERGIGQLEGLEISDHLLRGQAPPADLVMEENGLKFLVNLAEGQKTGYYLDQRDNRAIVARLAVGRKVLDAFCYAGGFGLQARRAGAISVECVDASETALELARKNTLANELTEVTFVKSDVFKYLEEQMPKAPQNQKRFGLIVLDPPKFARSQDSINEAMKGYRRLQTMALRLLEPGGFLVTCCCSGLITPDMLLDLTAQIATAERRDIRIIQRTGQPADHPVASTCPESSYLKCFISQVL